MKKKLILLFAVFIVVSVFIGCTEDDDKYTSLSIDTQYDGLPIDPDGYVVYTFTTGTAGVYTISLTNLASDLSWYLYDEEYGDEIDYCDYNWDSGDEIGTTPVLSANTLYYILIDEYDGVGGTFSILIESP